MMKRLFALLALLLAVPAVAQTIAQPLPLTIAPTGTPTFDERFTTLDACVDQTKPVHPCRWREVFGYGGALSVSNRTFDAETLFVEPTFTGITTAGVAGPAPLGLNPFKIGGYGLAITAKPAPASALPLLQGRTWTGGLLTTKFSFSQEYGYFEWKANLPNCTKGVWTGLWLLPIATPYWPINGEIDGPETIGDCRNAWSTHSGAEKALTQATPGYPARGYHTYGILWRADQIGFYVDRKLVASKATPADYHTPMFILMDLAVGGWAGQPDKSLQQAQMFIAYVRVWGPQ